MIFHRLTVTALVVALVLSNFGAPSAFAYTQSGASFGFAITIPMGHEWVTRMAAIELLGTNHNTVPDLPDPNDPRRSFPPAGRAKNLDLSSAGAQAEALRIKSLTFDDPLDRYRVRYKPVYDAIVGERWVDIGGYDVIAGKMGTDCWDAVAQEPAAIQYDHFMRRYDDVGGVGGVTAAKTSQERFIDYFVKAAIAPPTIMQVWDGGAAGSTAVEVDRNYFLFGRAAHMFQDSFSPEHTVRLKDDMYNRVRQVRSYICAPGSEGHSHAVSEILDYSSGDVIWNPGTKLDPSWRSYKASNMKIPALVATEATKDLWASFIRTMGTPIEQREAVARVEAKALIDSWLSYDEQEMLTWYNNPDHRDKNPLTYVLMPGESGPGVTQTECMKGLKVGTDDQMTYVRQLEKTQRMCIYNAVPYPGYDDLYDTSMHMWYSWHFLDGKKYITPPADWTIPDRAADTGIRVRIKSLANQQYMSAPSGLDSQSWVLVEPNQKPLDFIFTGTKADGAFRLTYAPFLFLSYKNVGGQVQLYRPPSRLEVTNYQVSPAGQGWSIKNIYWKQFVYLKKGPYPYIDRHGSSGNVTGQWLIEGLN